MSQEKTWTEVIDMDRLALGLTETHLSDRKAWSGRIKSVVRLYHPKTRGVVQYKLNSDNDCRQKFCTAVLLNITNLDSLDDLWHLSKMHIFQCMGEIFCVEFQREPLKFRTKYLTHTLKDPTLTSLKQGNHPDFCYV